MLQLRISALRSHLHIHLRIHLRIHLHSLHATVLTIPYFICLCAVSANDFYAPATQCG